MVNWPGGSVQEKRYLEMTDLALHLLSIPPSCRRGPGSPTPEATKAGLTGTAEPLYIQGEGRGLAVSRCVFCGSSRPINQQKRKCPGSHLGLSLVIKLRGFRAAEAFACLATPLEFGTR